MLIFILGITISFLLTLGVIVRPSQIDTTEMEAFRKFVKAFEEKRNDE